MKQPFQLDPARQEELLAEAADRHSPAVVTCKTSDGWSTLKSCLLGIERESRHLLIEYPACLGPVTPEMVEGQSLGISFRRGHKKCVCSAMVLGQCRFTLSGGQQVPALRLDWPEGMCELQRRLYYRVAAPEGLASPVELWRGDALEPQPGEPSCWGIILDLSAGGISVALPRDESPQWRENDQVTCSFAPDPTETPIVVVGRLRHWQEAVGGRLRVGLHFVGLDSCPDQRDTFQRVIDATARFQRAQAGPRRRHT